MMKSLSVFVPPQRYLDRTFAGLTISINIIRRDIAGNVSIAHYDQQKVWFTYGYRATHVRICCSENNSLKAVLHD